VTLLTETRGQPDAGKNSGELRRPFHGYHFKVLTRQGRAAPGGKKDYVVNGNTHGFALVAYPANWGRSGVMTFIAGPDGKVYQRNFGQKTGQTAAALAEYNPTQVGPGSR